MPEPGSSETETVPQAAVFGVRLDLWTSRALLDRMEDAIRRCERLTVTAPHFHILLDARRRPALRAFLNRCDINHIDGIGAWLAVRALHGRRLRGQRPERLTGTDLLTPWLARRLGEGLRLFVLGGSPDASEALARRFTAEGVDAACHHGAIALDDSAVPGLIEAFRPDVLLVSLGSSFQFDWLERYRGALDVPVAIATGGYVEFLAGTRPRAPQWMRRAGLEWLHRLAHEPVHLWRRYLLGIPSFLLALLREKLRRTS